MSFLPAKWLGKITNSVSEESKMAVTLLRQKNEVEVPHQPPTGLKAAVGGTITNTTARPRQLSMLQNRYCNCSLTSVFLLPAISSKPDPMAALSL